MSKNLVGKVCWFWNDDSDNKRLGILKEENGARFYGKYYDSYNDGFDSYRHCQEAKVSEVNFNER